MPGEKETRCSLPAQQLTVNEEARELEDALFLDVAEELSSFPSPSPSSSSTSSSSSSSSFSSSSSILCSSEDYITAETLSISQGSTSEDTSSSTTTSESKTDEDLSSQEDDDTSDVSCLPPHDAYLPRTPIDEKVCKLVNYLIFKYQVKELVTKEELLKVVIQEYEEHFPEILLRASEHMEIVFGLDVKEVDSINHCYALLIKLDLTYDGMLSEREGMPKTGLLILILGVIFMKGNHATEEEVWRVLNMMGIYSGRKHFIFGEPSNLIYNEFIHEKYLECHQLPNIDPPCYEFVWGPRARAELSKIKLLEFLSRVNGTEPSSFPVQYSDALKEEEERAQASALASLDATAMAIERSSATSRSCISSP